MPILQTLVGGAGDTPSQAKAGVDGHLGKAHTSKKLVDIKTRTPLMCSLRFMQGQVGMEATPLTVGKFHSRTYRKSDSEIPNRKCELQEAAMS